MVPPRYLSLKRVNDKIRFDKEKAKIKPFEVGDLVLLKNEDQNQTKLDTKFMEGVQVPSCPITKGSQSI